MRSLLGLTLAALVGMGCSHASEPAWPKQHAPEKDGGESLAPHEARAVAAVEASPDDKSSSSDDDKPAKTPGVPIAPAAATPSVAAPVDDVPVQTEEVIIEIDGSE